LGWWQLKLNRIPYDLNIPRRKPTEINSGTHFAVGNVEQFGGTQHKATDRIVLGRRNHGLHCIHSGGQVTGTADLADYQRLNINVWGGRGWLEQALEISEEAIALTEDIYTYKQDYHKGTPSQQPTQNFKRLSL
jgi:hypothetical protein